MRVRLLVVRFLSALVLAAVCLPALPDTALAACSVDSLNASVSGTSVQVTARGSCGGGVRAIRLKADGNIFYELGAPEVNASWNGASAGSHTVTAEVAAWGDNDWSSAASRSINVSVSGSPPAPTPQPSVSCRVDELSTSSAGNSVQVHARGSCNTGVRAIRLSTNGSVFYELGAPDLTATWTAPGPGTYTIGAEVAGRGDNDWTASASQTTSVSIAGSGGAPSPPGPPPPGGPAASHPTCVVDDFSTSAAGLSIRMHARGSCDSGVRALRFWVGSDIVYELGAPEASASWTAPGPGTYTLRAEVAGRGDNDWVYAGRWRTDVVVGAPATLTPAAGPTATPAPAPASSGVLASAIGLHSGDLIRSSNASNFEVDVVHGENRRWVPNPDTLNAITGRTGRQITTISDTNLRAIERADDIPDISRDPSGFEQAYAAIYGSYTPPAAQSACQQLGLRVGDLLRSSGDEIDILVDGCQRRWVPNPSTLNALTACQGRGVSRLSQSDFDAMSRGADIPDRDLDLGGFNQTLDSIYSGCVASPTTPAPGDVAGAGCHDAGLVRDGDIERRWCALGGAAGFLGEVTVSEQGAARSSFGTSGTYAAFRGGHIHQTSRYGAFETHARIDGQYLQEGGGGGWLGFPTSNEHDWNGGRRSDFEGGYIFWDGNSARAAHADTAPLRVAVLLPGISTESRSESDSPSESSTFSEVYRYVSDSGSYDDIVFFGYGHAGSDCGRAEPRGSTPYWYPADYTYTDTFRSLDEPASALDCLIRKYTAAAGRSVTFDLIGHSLGGAVALRYVRNGGAHIGHVVTLDSPVNGVSDNTAEYWDKVESTWKWFKAGSELVGDRFEIPGIGAGLQITANVAVHLDRLVESFHSRAAEDLKSQWARSGGSHTLGAVPSGTQVWTYLNWNDIAVTGEDAGIFGRTRDFTLGTDPNVGIGPLNLLNISVVGSNHAEITRVRTHRQIAGTLCADLEISCSALVHYIAQPGDMKDK